LQPRGHPVDLADDGSVVGIEVLNPARQWPLDDILARYEIDVQHVLALRALVAPEAREDEPALQDTRFRFGGQLVHSGR
jgi:hypothetical protein